MAQIKTSNFLPETFKTDANKKFLNATLDQLVTQPDLRKINAYVGRKFAPTFKSTDNYQPEPNSTRQNYQLEPSIVVKNKTTGETEFFSSYIDLLQQIEHYGGITSNQSRMFANESYSFDGLFDFDKFVNFNQYYWLPNGPDTVDVFGAQVPLSQTITVTRNPGTGTYSFSTNGSVENPTIKFAYGGVYKFVVDQPGYPFWIQTSAGINGLRDNQTNLSTRDVLGVENNGIDVGTITFRVPLSTAQDYFLRIPLAGSVDLSTTLHYSQIHGQKLSTIVGLGENGFDGVSAINQIRLKSLIFVGNQLDDSFWTVNDYTVPLANRLNAWEIVLSNDNDPIVTLNPLAQAFIVGALQKVYVKSGLSRSEYTYYLANDYLTNNVYILMPHITAPLTNLVYQDGVGSSFAGQIDLIKVTDVSFNADTDIIGKTTYTSPNGVVFTNGLKIKFDDSILPAGYANNTYYVEGVGTSIRLLDATQFITPESYAANGIDTQDFITINRGSQDLNPWSRSNRWFHIDVINATAAYRDTTPVVDQTQRANRPIIEFESDLQLYNFGRVAKNPVDLLITTRTDARNDVELQPAGYAIGGATLTNGMRIVFANDVDSTVINRIFTVNIVYISNLGGNVVNLVPADDYQVEVNNNLVVTQGTNKGIEYYYTGVSGNQWVAGQQKTKVNQSPLFDVINSTGYSLSTLTNSTFAGTKIFSYQLGTGSNDTVLGFPLSYRNFNQVGDIQFDNNFDADSFIYTDGTGTTVTAKINVSGTLQQNQSLTSYAIRNIWITNKEKSKQFQIIGGVYDGKNSYFKIDITANKGNTTPYFRVYRNSKLTTGYEVVAIGAVTYVHVTDSALTVGDQIDVLIYSDTVSKLGYYEVPKNLDLNGQNTNFSSLTLGQLRNHVTTCVENSTQIVGSFPGDSNLRDLNVKAQSGSILQHSAPILYSELFLIDQNANFIKSINLARHEYSKIKNKIIEVSQRTSKLDYTNIPVLLDTVLKTINSVKNSSFSWYYSDMVPYGDLKNTITYTVLNTQIVDYEITNIFNTTALSNTAVLVYLNNVQLIKDIDYKFDTNRSGVTIIKSLTNGDVITINEYTDTDGNYIPETPTKLGLYPKFTPSKIYDDTYQSPTYVIQGHDGSITPAFGDYRDDLLLEFEKRIYNNIKVDYQKNIFDIYNYLPGKFRSTDYSNKEFTQLLTNGFLQWVGGNRVDYVTNSYFVASEPFTWNYNKFNDNVDSETLLGYWRGIYRYFYDTDRPHTHPWEMLGFSEMPTWWEERYGPAPYTGGNLVLWEDLAAGYIYGEDRYDSRFVRNGLLKVIPVDDTGALRSPNQFLVKNFNSNQASGNFKIGDVGPVEAAWRRSSDYAFSIQQALALSYPSFYFGALIDIGRYYKNTDLDQYVLNDTLQRVTSGTVKINGNSVGGTVVRAASYINWIAEYLRNQGIDPNVKLNEYLTNVNIQLAYKTAGFTDKTFLDVVAEQSSPTSTNSGVIIPKDNYSVELYKSTPTKTVTYSGVVVERTGTGYTISGFDFDNPYFTIIPSLANNNSYPIRVGNDSGIIYSDFQKYKVSVPYGFEFANKQQIVDFLVSYQRYLKGVGFVFSESDPDLGLQRDFLLSVREFLTWAQQGWGSKNVIVLSPVLSTIKLTSRTGVVDQIENQPTQSRVVDTSYNFIKYSQLSANRENTVNGNTFTLNALGGQTIALAKLDVVEYEHIIIFDNKTIFNDIIYVPELGNRQYRLKLVGKKTGSWTGALNPPGFIYNNNQIDSWQPGKDYQLGSLVAYKNNNYTAIQDVVAATTFNPSYWSQLSTADIKTGLLPNFSYNANKFHNFNDVDNPETLGDFDLYSGSAIGFQPRNYLTNFGIDVTTQAKFYQGYIREKGSKNAVTAFTAAGFNNITTEINIFEEWAMRVGEYGALDNNRSVDVILSESTFNSNPATLTLLPNNAVADTGIIGFTPNLIYKTEGVYSPTIFGYRDRSSHYETDIQTAGYVNINDVNTTIFDIGNYAELSANIGKLGIGYTVWAAKDVTNNWNIYRVTETGLNVTQVAYNVDNIGTVTVNRPHTLSYGDIIAIKGFDTRVDGVYQVYNAVNAYSFDVVFYGQNITQIKSAMSITGSGPLFTLQSSRIKTATDLNSITPLQGWLDNDKLWVDNNNGTGTWAVYNKSTPWTGNVSFLNPSMKLNANDAVSSVGFGTVTAIAASGAFAVAGTPSLGMGNVIAFVANVTNGNVFTPVANLGARSSNSVSRFGASLDTAGNLLYIGDPGDGVTEYGRVHIHQFNGNASFPWTQTLSSPWGSNTGDTYGTSVSASADGAWLFVSAPNAGNVYVYHANTTNYYSYANTITVGSGVYDQFGLTVKTTSDASQAVISAPYQTVNGKTAAGAVYVYDRSIESFIANGTTYLTKYPINASTLKVTLNGNVVTSGFTSNANAVVFLNAPIIGSVVNIETNKIQLLEQLTAPTPTSGAAFGLTTYISGNDADVYVASPGYSAPGYYSGIVYRFVNQGASYGTITGANFTPAVTTGDSIRINGIDVVFTSTNAAVVATNINSANIAGVTATVTSTGNLSISSNVVTPYQKLVITPGPGTAISDLGLNVYTNVQSLMHPATDEVNSFGSQVVSSPDGSVLVISATGGGSYSTVTFDQNSTLFDYASTTFADTSSGTGSVYVYGLVGGDLAGVAQDQYVLVQRLQNNSLSDNDQFGYSIAMNANIMLVGAPGDESTLTIDPDSGAYVPLINSGTYYTYNNFSGNVGWDVVAVQEPKVDIDTVTNFYLYNRNTQVILKHLDYIDPAKGKILGAAQQDLDYITAYDPAVYNAVGGVDGTPNLANSLDFHWGKEQLYKTWWNVDSLRYINYEQGSLTYRANNWGRLFPGSTIQVAEWVESTVPPSAYAGPGTPLYPDNSAYSIVTTINPNTKLTTSRYYYWVVGKTSIEPESTHKSTVSTIADVIANPQSQGIPYAAAIRNDTISLYGVADYLTGNTVALHTDYDTLKNNNIIHSEYQLIGEGNDASNNPVRVVNKIIDSLSGIDANGNPVTPIDANGNFILPIQKRIGLGRNQTVFVDPVKALQNIIEYINRVMLSFPIAAESNISLLYDADPLPSETEYDIQVASYTELTSYVDTTNISTGYAVLVLSDETQQGLWAIYTFANGTWALTKTQEYSIPLYWDFVDWYSSTYDSTTTPTYVVNTISDIALLTVNVGDTIKVLNTGSGNFGIYRVNSSGQTDLVGIQKGTVKFLDTLWTTNANPLARRGIVESYSIFITNFNINSSDLLFAVINYILTEQASVDWVFKTSFITVFHKLRKLNQPANYILDNQTYYENYINEVKPYRTSIREYRIDYQGSDTYDTEIADFDIPSTYISSDGKYRSPNGVNPNDATWLSTLPQYSQWYNNYTYGIGEVVVTNPGAGYALTPLVTVTGGGGSGAKVNAVVDFGSGQIIKFEVVAPGSGYTTQPTIFINGTGTGASGYARLSNHYQIDSLLTTQIVANANVTVYAGNIITQPNTGAYGTVYSASSGNVITLVDVTGTFANYQYLYSDLANLGTTTSNSISSYTQFVNNSYNTVRNIKTTLLFDRTSYSSNIQPWVGNITVNAGEWRSYNGQAYEALSNVYSTATLVLNSNVNTAVGNYVTQANATGNARVLAVSSNLQLITLGNISGSYQRRGGNILVNGIDANARPLMVNNIFDYTKYKSLAADSFYSAVDRIKTYYAPTADMPGTDPSQLMSGIGYPGTIVTGTNFSANTGVTTITSNILYAYSNIGMLFSSNTSVFDFTKQGYSINQPVTLTNLDNNATYKLIIADIEKDRLVVSGISNVIVQGANLSLSYYDYSSSVYLDSIIQNSYTNTSFGTSPNDIGIDGGGYVDTYSSHAPEELMPGIIYDNLNMVVTTKINSNSSTMSYRVVYDMHSDASTVYFSGNGFGANIITAQTFYSNGAISGNIWANGVVGNQSTNYARWPKYYAVSAAHTTTLAANLNITDSNIRVTNASVLTAPNLTQLYPGIVYINGEKITFWTIDTVNNVLGQIRRAVDGTGAPMVHVAGSAVVESNLPELIPGGNLVHTSTWLNSVSGTITANIIADNYGNVLVTNANDPLTTTGATAAITDGLGLENSLTDQAVFIKNLQ